MESFFGIVPIFLNVNIHSFLINCKGFILYVLKAGESEQDSLASEGGREMQFLRHGVRCVPENRAQVEDVLWKWQSRSGVRTSILSPE